MKLFFLFLLLPLQLLAQPDSLWTRTYLARAGGAACYAMDSAWGGGFILAGKYNFANSGGEYFQMKTDQNGDSVWCRLGVSMSSSVAYAVHRTFDGGYFLAGKRDANDGTGCYWLMKTDSVGIPLWSRTYTKPNQDQAWAHCFAAIQTADSGFLLTGTLGSGVYNSADEVWVMKANSIGDMVWSKGVRSTMALVESRAACELADGSFLVECKFSSQGFGLLHLSAAGDSLGYRSYFADNSIFYALTPTRDGGYFLAGRWDGWLGPGWRWLRLNAQLDSLWSGTYGYTIEIGGEAHTAIETPDSGFILAGTALGETGCTMIRLSQSGEILSNHTIAGDGTEWWSMLPYQTSGGWLAAGFATSGTVRLWALADDSMFFVIPNPASIDFETVVIGDTVSRQAYLVNRARASVSIGGISNAHPDRFLIDQIGQTQIEAGDSMMYRVVCINNALETRLDTIVFAFENSSGQVRIPLRVFGEQRADARDEMNSAAQFKLSPNYPNPFNPETRISFDLPQADLAQLQIFDINGRTVATLLDGITSAGHHNISFNGRALPSGVYFYHLQAGDYSATRKMLLLK